LTDVSHEIQEYARQGRALAKTKGERRTRVRVCRAAESIGGEGKLRDVVRKNKIFIYLP
jgi:hypothetical protein